MSDIELQPLIVTLRRSNEFRQILEVTAMSTAQSILCSCIQKNNLMLDFETVKFKFRFEPRVFGSFSL